MPVIANWKYDKPNPPSSAKITVNLYSVTVANPAVCAPVDCSFTLMIYRTLIPNLKFILSGVENLYRSRAIPRDFLQVRHDNSGLRVIAMSEGFSSNRALPPAISNPSTGVYEITLNAGKALDILSGERIPSDLIIVTPGTYTEPPI